MGERKQKGLLTVTLIAVTDCHISSFTPNLLNTKFQIKFSLALCVDLFTKRWYISKCFGTLHRLHFAWQEHWHKQSSKFPFGKNDTLCPVHRDCLDFFCCCCCGCCFFTLEATTAYYCAFSSPTKLVHLFHIISHWISLLKQNEWNYFWLCFSWAIFTFSVSPPIPWPQTVPLWPPY